MFRVKFSVLAIVLLFFYPGSAFPQHPVISFDVQPGKNRTVIIQWSTRPGTDSVQFSLERSLDKISWQPLSTEVSHLSPYYSYIDLNPVEGVNYYRIRQSREGGHFSLTDPKWIQINQGGKLYIWPNPSNDILHVRCPFVNGNMDIADAEGRFLMKIIISGYITDVRTSGLSRGIYYLHVRHGNRAYVEKFVKE